MPAVVIPMETARRGLRSGRWCLLELALPRTAVQPWGILLADDETGELCLRLREPDDAQAGEDGLSEQDRDVLETLGDDLRAKAREAGGAVLLDQLADSLSNVLRISDPEAIEFTGDAQRKADGLFERHVDAEIRPFVTHLPFYGLRAAATKFGESMDVEPEGWVRAPERLRLTANMFVAQVVGRSMEPLIPDGSRCIFRAGVAGSRQGKRLLIEQTGETDFAARYTVKRYASTKSESGGSWEHTRVRLEPLNPEFEAFDLGPDDFRVIAEFVAVLETE